MADPTTMHNVSTSLPDDLFDRFEADRIEADRNIAQQLRVIVRDYYRMLDKQRQAILRVPKESEETRIMPLPTAPRPLEPYVGRQPEGTRVTWPDPLPTDAR